MIPSVSLIFPTYNERENLRWLIPQVEAAFAGTPCEILIVDDGSPDGTADEAEALNRTYGNIRVIRRPGRAGLGSAIRRGYDEARHDLLISCDADGSFSAHDLVRLAATAAEGYDLVLGSRHSAGARYETPRWAITVKYCISWLGNWLLRQLLRVPLHDFSSNCRAIRRTTWQTLQTRERTNALLLEMILQVAAVGGRITEIPVTFVDRRCGRSKLNLWVEIPIYLLVMWRHVIRWWW